MLTLIVDYHRNDQRITDLTQILRALFRAEPDVRTQLHDLGNDREPLLSRVVDEITVCTQNKDLILLHCGPDQHLLPGALDLFQAVPCLLYFGGALLTKIANHIQGGASSEKHAVIPETLDLGGLTEEQKRRLKHCVRLMFSDPKKSPRVAVEESFGDPGLERILNDLSARLSPELTVEAIATLKRDRDLALEEHYRRKRGW